MAPQLDGRRGRPLHRNGAAAVGGCLCDGGLRFGAGHIPNCRDLPIRAGARKLRPVTAFARWLPASGLLAAVALALTGLISPPPPVAGAPPPPLVDFYPPPPSGPGRGSGPRRVGVARPCPFPRRLPHPLPRPPP